jgi:hypothetical protein
MGSWVATTAAVAGTPCFLFESTYALSNMLLINQCTFETVDLAVSALCDEQVIFSMCVIFLHY